MINRPLSSESPTNLINNLKNYKDSLSRSFFRPIFFAFSPSPLESALGILVNCINALNSQNETGSITQIFFPEELIPFLDTPEVKKIIKDDVGLIIESEITNKGICELVEILSKKYKFSIEKNNFLSELNDSNPLYQYQLTHEFRYGKEKRKAKASALIQKIIKISLERKFENFYLTSFHITDANFLEKKIDEYSKNSEIFTALFIDEILKQKALYNSEKDKSFAEDMRSMLDKDIGSEALKPKIYSNHLKKIIAEYLKKTDKYNNIYLPNEFYNHPIDELIRRCIKANDFLSDLQSYIISRGLELSDKEWLDSINLDENQIVHSGFFEKYKKSEQVIIAEKIRRYIINKNENNLNLNDKEKNILLSGELKKILILNLNRTLRKFFKSYQKDLEKKSFSELSIKNYNNSLENNGCYNEKTGFTINKDTIINLIQFIKDNNTYPSELDLSKFEEESEKFIKDAANKYLAENAHQTVSPCSLL